MPRDLRDVAPRDPDAGGTVARPPSWRAAHPMLLSFRTNRWRWPWAVLTTILAFGLALSSMLAASLLLPQPPPDAPDTVLMRVGEPNYYILIFVGWSLLAASGLIALRLIKGDAAGSVLTSADRFHGGDLVKAGLAILLTFSAASLLTYLVAPNDFSASPWSAMFWRWLLIGLAVIFVQSSAEEIFFRGALLRTWGAVLPYTFAAPALIMCCFIALHVPNADVQRDLYVGLSVFVLGEVLAYYALLRTKSLAAPMGLHFANNAFQFFLVRTRPPDDVDTAIFVYTDPVYAAHGSRLLDPMTYVMAAAGAILIVLLLFWSKSPLYLPRRDVAGQPDAAVIDV